MGASLEGLGPGGARPHARPRHRSADPHLDPAPVAEEPLPRGLPKLLISCSIPLDQVRQMIASGHPWFAALAGPEWSFLELAHRALAHGLGPRRAGFAAARRVSPARSGTRPGGGLSPGGFAEDLVDAAELAQAGLGLAADPAAERLHRDPELPGRGLLGEAFAWSMPESQSAKERCSGRSRRGGGRVLAALAGRRRTSTSTPSGKMRKPTWIWPPSGLAASSRALRTAWWSCWLPSGLSEVSRR